MNIAYMQSEYGGAQISGYPHSRDFVATLKRLSLEGHKIQQVYPLYSPTGLIHKYFNDSDLRKSKLQEHFNVGVSPSPVDFIPDADLVLVYALAWTSMNTYKAVEILQKYTDVGIPIVVYNLDAELRLQPKKSFFFHLIKTKHPDIYDNISKIFSCVPDIVEDLDAVYYPTVYDPSYEIDIIPPSECTTTFRFGGPVAFRETLGLYMDNIIRSANLPCVFANESIEASRKSYGSSYFNTIERYSESPKVKITDKPIYGIYGDYIQHMSSSLLSLGDSTFVSDGVVGKNHHTTRIIDGLYSGNVSLMTDTYTVFRYLRNSDMFTLSKVDIDSIVHMSDEVYVEYVQTQRDCINEAFGIDTWYKVFLEGLCEVVDGKIQH